MKIFYSLLLFFLLLASLFFTTSVHAATFDMATNSNWNIRFDGPSAGGYLTHTGIITADLDNNGKLDIIIPSPFSSFNSRANSGSVYVIYDSLLTQLSGTGNTLDLTNSSNYNIRFDGDVAKAGSGTGDGIGNGLNVIDVNSDGKPDLVLAGPQADNNSRRNSGSLYIIYNALISSYSGTGNTVDLATASNYNIRVDGDQADPFGNLGIGDGTVEADDLDGDGKKDLLVIQQGGTYNSRSTSGALFVLYNTLLSSYTGTGNTIDLGSSTGYNLRFDGASANDRFSAYGVFGKDLDSDNRQDLVVSAANASYNSRSSSGSVYFINNNLFRTYIGTGNAIDMASSANWTFRMDGASGSNLLSFNSLRRPIDVNADGKEDLLVGAGSAGNNSRSLSGSFYIIMGIDDVFQSYSGTGNTRDMATSSNWNIRFDGVAAGDHLSTATLRAADIFNTGKQDIMVGARQAGNNGRSESGSFWTIPNSVFSAVSGTGNTIDMATSSNWNSRYDGAGVGDWLSYLLSSSLSDLNGDGKLDILVGSNTADNNSRTDSGSLYIIYNFPHTISVANTSQGTDSYQIKGTVSAPNSVTTISGVQYQMDSNSPSSGWSSCTADDGSFNSTSEQYTCTSGVIAQGTHTMYVRAYDSNSSYTAQSSYVSRTVANGTGTAGGSSEGSSVPQIGGGSGGVCRVADILTIMEPHTVAFDAYCTDTIQQTTRPRSITRLGSVYWQIGDIHDLWYKDYYNHAKILAIVQHKPSIVALSYTDRDLIPPGKPTNRFNPKSLKLAYSIDGIHTWKILPTSVVDTVNHTVAALSKIGGYYMIVGR